MALPDATRLHVHVARTAFRRYATYRAATLASLVESTVMSVLRAYVWLAVIGGRGSIDGFDQADVVTFSFAAMAVHTATHVTWETEIGERIRSGDVVTDLYRPVDFQGWWFAHEAGRCAYATVFRGVPPFFVGALLFDLGLPSDVGTWLEFAAAAVAAFCVVFAWRFLVSLSGFWLLNPLGAVQVAAFLYTACSGSLVPLPFMPDGIEAALRWLPFASMLQLPVDVLIGDRSAVSVVPVQLLWAVVLLGAGRVVLRRAERRLVVQGG